MRGNFSSASGVMPKKVRPPAPPPFLVDLLNARSPSGYESEAQAVWDAYVSPKADTTARDALGNRISTFNPEGDPVLMLAGHFDELGLLITYVNNDGFLYFATLGGIDRLMIPGRRVIIQTKAGPVMGVTGKRAVHLLDSDERKKIPEIHDMWIDIGAGSRKEALQRVSIGDVATVDHGFELMNGSIGVARAFDNKAGAYVAGETLVRLADAKKKPLARVVAVATAQEEIGVRGATVATFGVNPHVAVVIDVSHATDHPDCDKRRFGDFRLGGGPMITRGPNVNPWVFDTLLQCADRAGIPYQLEGDPRPTGSDARAVQVARAGVATGLVCVPLRYMHTPCEIVDLQDIEACVQLMVEFARTLKPGDNGHW